MKPTPMEETSPSTTPEGRSPLFTYYAQPASYSPSVVHEPSHQCFSLHLHGAPEPALLEYEALQDKHGVHVFKLVHTYVPPALRGRGVAGKLVRFAFAYARENNIRIVPICSYIPVYLERNPGDLDIVVEQEE